MVAKLPIYLTLQVDRSAAYAARWVAKSVVASGLARRCLLQVSYAIGVSEPLSISVMTYGSGKKTDEEMNKTFEMDDICSTFEQAIMLLGQAQVSLQYERRMMVLETTGSHERAKQLLNDHRRILEEEREGDDMDLVEKR